MLPRERAEVVDDYLPGHGDRSYDVTRYALDLVYKLEGNQLSGRATITATATEDLARFGLDLHGLRTTKVSIPVYGVARFAARGRKLVVTTKSPIPVGTLTPRVRTPGRVDGVPA